MSGQKLERLLNLTALLLDARRPLTAEQIQQQLDYPEDLVAFRRAFERDKDELRTMGIPLRIEKVPGVIPEVDGYRIPREEYALRDPGLTTEELAALHLAASAVQVEGLPATEGLLKLGGLVTEGAHDLGVHVAPLPADPNLARLFGAVSSRTPVRLRYHDEERTVDPYRLEFQRGRWYLTGYDHLRDEERNYRLDRIDGVVGLTDEPAFDPPATAVPGRARGTWELGAEEPVRARVRIDGPAGRVGGAARRTRPRGGGGRRRLGRGRAARHQPGRLPIVRAVVPRPCRGARARRAAGRPDRVAVVSAATSAARMQRLLSMVPWIAAHDGPTLDEVCTRFDVTPKELAADLEVMWLVGLPPYTPDALIDVVQEGDRVWIHFADVFDAPQRLTPDQAVALLTAGASVLALPGRDDNGALARGVAKLASVLGVDADQVLDVDLGLGGADVLDVLRTAVTEHRRVHLDYYSFGRDVRTERDVDPYVVQAQDGSLYVLGHCHLAGGERRFRVDRIARATLLDEHFDPPPTPPAVGVFQPDDDDPRVVLDLDAVSGLGGRGLPGGGGRGTRRTGSLRVRLAVAAEAWFERLLVGLGPQATVVDAPDALLGRGAARQRPHPRPLPLSGP